MTIPQGLNLFTAIPSKDVHRSKIFIPYGNGGGNGEDFLQIFIPYGDGKQKCGDLLEYTCLTGWNFKGEVLIISI